MGWLEELTSGEAHRELIETVREAITSSPFHPKSRPSISASGGSTGGGSSGGGGLHDIAAEQIETILSSSKNLGPQGFVENVLAFSAAIAWDVDRWIWVVLIFHLLTFSVILWKRRSHDAQRNALIIILPLIFAAHSLNDIGGDRWRSFASQNYFDKNGIFVGVMWAGPLLVNGFIATANLVVIAGNMLVAVKRNELQSKARKKKKNK